jgi:hypothetical protein
VPRGSTRFLSAAAGLIKKIDPTIVAVLPACDSVATPVDAWARRRARGSAENLLQNV